MKGIDEVTGEVARRLTRVWAQVLAGAQTWPDTFPLGAPATSALERDFAPYAALARMWTAWAAGRPVQLVTKTRRVAGGAQVIPTHLVVPGLAAAAELVGGPWPNRVAVGAQRLAGLRDQFAHLDADTAGQVTLVKAIADWSDVDVQVLAQAGRWFTGTDGAGLTPRQIPILGMHAKWLNTGAHLVALLAGRSELNLAPRHPARVHFTYLDPDHRAGGGRRHDSHTVGDRVQLPYPVHLVLISENKDTAVLFEPVPGAVALEGEGANANVIAALDWVRAAQHVVYWGDMDVDGLHILSRLRSTGLDVTSMLMDENAYREWGRFGTNTDKGGRALHAQPPRSDVDLTVGERALYEQLCDPTFDGFRRVEQERIPLTHARTVLESLVAAAGTSVGVRS